MIDLSALFPGTHNRFIDRLNWGMLVAPGVILCKDGSLLAGWRVEGLDTESMEAVTLDASLKTLAFRLSSLGDAHTVWSVFRRGPAGLSPGDVPLRTGNPALDALAEETLEQLSAPGTLWEGRLEMFLSWAPPPGNRDLVSLLDAFAGECAGFERRIAPVFRAARLGPEPGAQADTDGPATAELSCALCGALASLLGQERRVGIPEDGSPVALDVLLGAEVIQPGGGDEGVRVDDRPLTVLSFDGWPPTFEGTPLETLQDQELSFAWVTRYNALSRKRVREEFEWRRKIWLQSASDMVADVVGEGGGRRGRFEDAMAEEMEESIAETGTGETGHGFLTSQLLLIGREGGTRADLGAAVAQLKDVAENRFFRLREERAGALGAWLSALPGHGGINQRKVLMNAGIFASTIPVRSIWRGAATCPSPHLPPGTPPLALARSHTGEVFRFNLHHGEVGHSLVFGPTGAGKSVLLAHLASCWLRYGQARVIFFDRGGSVRHACHALGGRFVEPGTGGRNGVAPLAHVAELGADWALGWLTELVRREIGAVGVEQGQELRRAAQDMARPGAQLLRLHEVARRFDGRPTLVILDEAWSFFEHAMFEERIRDWLKTGRKRNVAVVMATQSITDATGANITAHLLESCPTRIFLPNPEATGPLIARDYATLGLSPAQIDLVARIEAKRDYYILQPERRRVVRFPFGPRALDLLARTSARDSQRAAALAEQTPDDAEEELHDAQNTE